MRLLPGGASKEAWAVDAGGERLLVRRALGGVIHRETLPLEQEFEVLRAAAEAGVKVPAPVAYLGLLGGREAFATQRVEGETIGRRIVRSPPAGLPLQSYRLRFYRRRIVRLHQSVETRDVHTYLSGCTVDPV